MQHKALRKIFLLNTIILFVESIESHNSYFIVITYTADAKIVTKAHRCHCKSNYSTIDIQTPVPGVCISMTPQREDRESHHCKQCTIEISDAPQRAPTFTF